MLIYLAKKSFQQQSGVFGHFGMQNNNSSQKKSKNLLRENSDIVN